MSASGNNKARQTAIRSLLADTTEPLYVLRPSLPTLELLVQAVETDAPTLHVLASSDDLQAVRRQFPLATVVAELQRQDQLTLTAAAPTGRGTVLVTDETAYAVAHVDGELVLCDASSTPDTLLEICREYHETESFDLRTPAWGTVSERLIDTFNTDVEADFRFAIQEWMETVDEQALGTAEIALLVAGMHDLLLYDLSRWGEELGVASKATFSRGKATLVKADILTSEKVPIDVGRPRLRLTLTDEYAAYSVAELLDQANETVSR